MSLRRKVTYMALYMYLRNSYTIHQNADTRYRYKCVHKLPYSQFVSLEEHYIFPKTCQYYPHHSTTRKEKLNDSLFKKFLLT